MGLQNQDLIFQLCSYNAKNIITSLLKVLWLSCSTQIIRDYSAFVISKYSHYIYFLMMKSHWQDERPLAPTLPLLLGLRAMRWWACSSMAHWRKVWRQGPWPWQLLVKIYVFLLPSIRKLRTIDSQTECALLWRKWGKRYSVLPLLIPRCILLHKVLCSLSQKDLVSPGFF